MFLSTLFWNRCMTSTLLGFVQPHSRIPYSKRVLLFGCKVAICCEGTAMSSFLTASSFFVSEPSILQNEN
jgi:hypothetical protein